MKILIWLNDLRLFMFGKLSNSVMTLTICQLWYILAVRYELFTTTIEFNILHEDTILIMHLMTWFIVRAIENSVKR